MKELSTRAIALVLMFGFFHLNASLLAGEIILMGKVTNPSARKAIVHLPSGPLNLTSKSYDLRLNENQEINAAIPFDQAGILKFEYAGEEIEIYADPEDIIQFSFEGKKLLSSLTFSGRKAQIHGFRQHFYQRFPKYPLHLLFNTGHLPYWQDSTIVQLVANTSLRTCWGILDDRQNEQLALLDSIELLAPEQAEVLRQEIIYETLSAQLAWPILTKAAMSPDDFRWIDKKIIPVLKKQDDAFESEAYLRFLASWLYYRQTRDHIYKRSSGFAFYEIADRYLFGRARWFMLARLFVLAKYAEDMELATVKFKDYASKNPYPEYTDWVNNIYGSQLSVLSSGTAPNFSLQNVNGQNLRLWDYRGKVVYMGFWASWCKPCLDGFQKYRQLREQLDEMGVVLLNVSIDEKESNWLEAMLKHQITGEHVLASDIDGLRKAYRIGSIPAYFIIDKSGELVNLNRDGKGIVGQFKRLLKE